MSQYLINNADDFGASVGVNRGIFESHRRGVVTSTSLMMTGRAVCEAVAISRDSDGDLVIGSDTVEGGIHRPARKLNAEFSVYPNEEWSDTKIPSRTTQN